MTTLSIRFVLAVGLLATGVACSDSSTTSTLTSKPDGSSGSHSGSSSAASSASSSSSSSVTFFQLDASGDACAGGGFACVTGPTCDLDPCGTGVGMCPSGATLMTGCPTSNLVGCCPGNCMNCCTNGDCVGGGGVCFYAPEYANANLETACANLPR